MSNGAPVCNLPNIGQVPALQPGRMFPAVPKAVDLPSALQAANILSQILLMLIRPGAPPFRNNLAPFNAASNLVGTPGLHAGEGADGSGNAKGKKGEKGEDAKQPSWVLGSYRGEEVKVTNPEDHDEFVVVKRITGIEFVDAKGTNANLFLTIRPK